MDGWKTVARVWRRRSRLVNPLGCRETRNDFDSFSFVETDLLRKLITRDSQSRLSLPSLQNHSYFSSLAVSTLNFLDPSNFASKPREEKASFLKGLLRVLPGFSDRLKKKKILPSLFDEVSLHPVALVYKPFETNPKPYLVNR